VRWRGVECRCGAGDPGVGPGLRRRPRHDSVRRPASRAADDPHTKGEAEDIGVNSLLRSSAAQISEAQLARYGLYRPFDPFDNAANTEVNHIQLIPSSGPLSVAQSTATFDPDPSCS
jgi:hypothetical protein